MSYSKNKLTRLLLILLILISASMAFPQFEPETKVLPERRISETIDNRLIEEVPATYWLKINAFGTISLIIVILAFILGFVSIFIGWNAGGRINSRTIKRSILSTFFIAIFARPVFNLGQKLIGQALATFLPDSYAYGISGLIIYIIMVFYFSAIPVFLYEAFTVTAKEAYPPRQ